MFSQSSNNSVNGATKLLSSDKSLTIGGYGQIDYNQPIENGKIQNGKLILSGLFLKRYLLKKQTAKNGLVVLVVKKVN